MARYLFDGGEQVVGPTGAAQTNQAFTVWTDPFGGEDVTGQMRAPNGVSTATVATDGDGEVPFLRGPDGWRLPLYRDMGTGTRSPWYSGEAWTEIVSAITAMQDYIASNPGGGGGGGIPPGTTLDAIVDSGSRIAMTPTERNKLATVATGATALTLAGGGSSSQAMRSDRVFTAAQVGAVANIGGFSRVLGWTGPGLPTAANGLQEGDWVAIVPS